MTPRIVELPAFHVVGLQETLSPSTTWKVPELWGRFVAQIISLRRTKGTATYGLSRGVPGSSLGEPRFEYTAAVEVESPGPAPRGLVAFTVPAATYAVFTHEGHISGIGATMEAIWSRWLPVSGRRPAEGISFERYDERWDSRTGTGPVDVYVPVRVPSTTER